MDQEPSSEEVATNRCYCGPVSGSLMEHLGTQHPAECIGECLRCLRVADLSGGDWAYCRPCVAAMKAGEA